MSYVITAGGTGGHIYPALAVAAELQKQGKQVVFAGNIDGMEERMAREAGLSYQGFAAKGFDRQKPWTLLSSTLLLARSTGEAKRWLHEIQAEAVAAFGGYASVPVGRAAVSQAVPLLIHEQNSAMGWTNKHLSKQATTIALTYAAAADYLDERARQRVQITGNPVRPEFSALADTAYAARLGNEFRQELGFTDDQLILLIFGGSQGARHINQAMVALSAELMKHPKLAVLHLTGRKEYASVASALSSVLDSSRAERWHLVDYCDQMPAAFAASDIVISRAGASSLAELAVAAKPALLIPFPYATADHQRKNAESLVAAGAAHMILDKDLDSPQFLESLLTLVDDTKTRTHMQEAAEQFKDASAALQVANLLIGIAQEA